MTTVVTRRAWGFSGAIEFVSLRTRIEWFAFVDE